MSEQTPPKDSTQATTPETNKSKEDDGSWNFKDALRFILISLLIVIPIRVFVAQPFLVSGASMQPTFETGEYLVVDQLSYRLNEPKRGSVAIFKFPNNQKKYYIKRIIGLPEETIIINGSKVTIVNSENPEGFMLNEPYLEFTRSDNITITLDDDEYYVLGDNRLASSDSRSWGPVKSDLIVGRPIIRLLPLTGIDVLPGNYEY